MAQAAADRDGARQIGAAGFRGNTISHRRAHSAKPEVKGCGAVDETGLDPFGGTLGLAMAGPRSVAKPCLVAVDVDEKLVKVVLAVVGNETQTQRQRRWVGREQQ